MNQHQLMAALEYSPETGEFTRKRPTKACLAGRPAGRVHKKRGYREIYVCGRLYYAHRLAWLYMTGEWPKNEIDHINHDRDDNRWSNLRDVTCSVNQQNREYVSGAHIYRAGDWVRWNARIHVDGKTSSLGYFKTREEAEAAYKAAKPLFHPAVNHQRIS